jgi:hypothetical protein
MLFKLVGRAEMRGRRAAKMMNFMFGNVAKDIGILEIELM